MSAANSRLASEQLVSACQQVQATIRNFSIPTTPRDVGGADGLKLSKEAVEAALALSVVLRAMADSHGYRDHQSEASLSV